MSDLLRTLAAHIRNNADSEIHVVSGQDLSDDESGFSATAEPKRREAKWIDSNGCDVGDPQPGKLAYFMDGIERKHVPLYVSMIPVVYGYVAAVVRMRCDEKKMHTYSHKRREALYLPRRLVKSGLLDGAGIDIIDTETEDKPLEEHPIILREAARVAIGKSRGRLETELAKKWLEDFQNKSEWLLVDGSLGGTLGGDYQKYENPNIVGIIKSHNTQYFPMDEQRKILNLRVGERSGVFMPLAREQAAPVYSWYLRLRPNAGQDVYFGLIRVEAPATQRALDMADEISRWLLAERSPLSLPDSRWDKMFYPIRDCEQYLRSLAPTKIMLESFMMGLGSSR